jgi:hypothetical protein
LAVPLKSLVSVTPECVGAGTVTDAEQLPAATLTVISAEQEIVGGGKISENVEIESNNITSNKRIAISIFTRLSDSSKEYFRLRIGFIGAYFSKRFPIAVPNL